MSPRHSSSRRGFARGKKISPLVLLSGFLGTISMGLIFILLSFDPAGESSVMTGPSGRKALISVSSEVDHMDKFNEEEPPIPLFPAVVGNISLLADDEEIVPPINRSAGDFSIPLSKETGAPIQIAYAISLIKCGDKQSSVAGLNDAALILRHSVHQTSVRNPASGSKYDYKMYAIVRTKAKKCAQPLRDAGFEILVRDPPVKKEEIQGEFLRTHVHKEWCCGSDEFVKLYAYTIDAPIVVHTDIDFVFHQPMDNLFDAMLYDKDSPEGVVARSKVEREFSTDAWPDRIDAFFTKDWPQVMPGRKPGYQAGFLVTRPSEAVFNLTIDVIREGDYKEGFGRDNGWGSKGYGAFVGAMAMQGLMAFVYDHKLNNTWVELNQCRYNHMGIDTLFRKAPGFRRNHPKAGKCRNDRDYCEDCMNTDIKKVYNIHYTHCRKPWNCIGEPTDGGRGLETVSESVVFDHCMELMDIWHGYRTDLENKLAKLTGDESILSAGRVGDYKSEFFHGHCKGNGGNQYITLQGKRESYQRLPELYAV